VFYASTVGDFSIVEKGLYEISTCLVKLSIKKTRSPVLEVEGKHLGLFQDEKYRSTRSLN
jgi:hypothetical protein